MHPPVRFGVDFAALLLAGPQTATLVAIARVLTEAVVRRHRPNVRAWTAVHVLTSVAAVQFAGLVHVALHGAQGHFPWPWQVIPLAAALLSYCLVEGLSTQVIVPLASRRGIDRARIKRLVESWPNYVIAAGIAVGLVELGEHRMWQLLPAAALPLLFAFRAYGLQVKQLEIEHRRREVADALDLGMCVVDDGGAVTIWDDGLERILGRSRAHVLGRSLIGAMPELATSELPRAVKEALATRSPRTIPQLGFARADGARVLQVKIVPVADGLTLLWHDLTERARAEHSLRLREERLTLAAEGAYDGLWAWDLRTHEVFFSGRWRAMVGLDPTASTGTPHDWMDRVHPDDMETLKQALHEHLAGETDHFEHEHRIRHEGGSYRRVLCYGLAARGQGGRAVRIAGSLTDVTDRGARQDRIAAGMVDPLTGLCNRTFFVEGLGRRLKDLKRGRGGARFAVLYLDLDRFKVVNDSLGHLVGDELLIAVSRRLESCVRPGDVVSRLGGDEFAILLNGLNDEQQANVIAFRIRESLSAAFAIGGREVFTSASIGIAFGLPQYSNPDDIMRDADTAMYHAKSRGKARHELFDADMHARTRDRLDLETDLRHAVNSKNFEVHYQPIVSLASGRCVGFESLVRWTRNGEPISPATFIPIAEELGLIESIGTWVLDQACHTFADWQRRFPGCALDCITVNVSSRQLMQQNFARIVEQAIARSGLRARDLRLEITETALMDSPRVVADVLRDLRELGVKIYLDDFGTGYSSLSHLHKLPVDALKIDRSFVRSLVHTDRPAIVESILALARTLNTSVVAEGIESEHQSRELERLGCTHAQGFLFSRPISAARAEELLHANQPLGPKQYLATSGPTADLHYVPKTFGWPAHILSTNN